MRRFNLGLLGLALCVGCAAAEPDRTSGGGSVLPGGSNGNGDGSGNNGGAGNNGGSGNNGGGGAGPGFGDTCGESIHKAGLSRGANIVWVIDNSGSMDEEAVLVQENINRFVQSIVSAGLEDYRVVVMTKSGFVNVPDPLGSDTVHFRYVDENVKSHEPLEDIVGRYDDFKEFLLPGVITHFVVVTDDESEDLTAQDFVSRMKSKMNGVEFRLHAIASPPDATRPAPQPTWPWDDDDDDTGCVGPYGSAAAPGVQHYAAADLTMGLKFSLCESDWSGLFTELAREVESSATIPCELPLPEPDGDGSLDIHKVNLVLTPQGSQTGSVIPKVDTCSGTGWTYDNPNNPSSIKLCPQTCQAAASAAALEIEVGCSTVVL